MPTWPRTWRHRAVNALRRPDFVPVKNDDAGPVVQSMVARAMLNPWSIDPVVADTDIRIRWEPARLQLATAWMAYAQRFPESPFGKQASQAAKTSILSWIEANPFMHREHYRSAMECALRIPVFFMHSNTLII
jgi:hypothetical protein